MCHLISHHFGSEHLRGNENHIDRVFIIGKIMEGSAIQQRLFVYEMT